MNENELQFMVNEVFDDVYAEDNVLVFRNENMVVSFYHEQDCCEDVFIESIVGDLEDLVGAPILLAEVSSNDDYDAKPNGENIYLDDLTLWTFYKFATRKGYVDVRWFGSSNGYYSVGVNVKVEYLKNRS